MSLAVVDLACILPCNVLSVHAIVEGLVERYDAFQTLLVHFTNVLIDILETK